MNPTAVVWLVGPTNEYGDNDPTLPRSGDIPKRLAKRVIKLPEHVKIAGTNLSELVPVYDPNRLPRRVLFKMDQMVASQKRQKAVELFRSIAIVERPGTGIPTDTYHEIGAKWVGEFCDIRCNPSVINSYTTEETGAGHLDPRRRGHPSSASYYKDVAIGSGYIVARGTIDG